MAYSYFPCQITQILDETDVVKRFFFKAPDDVDFNFQPGQFVMLNLPIASKYTNRSYSIASAPKDNNEFELVIVLNPPGLGTPYLWENVKAGDTIDVARPLGKFTLKDVLITDKIDHELCFIATGTGIAPLRSMIHHILCRNIEHKKLHLIFGNRWEKDILYRREFEELQKQYPTLEFHPILSRENPGWTGRKGYVHQVYEEIFADKRPATFYLCGWKDMLHEARQRIEALGYDRKRIKFEAYD